MVCPPLFQAEHWSTAAPKNSPWRKDRQHIAGLVCYNRWCDLDMWSQKKNCKNMYSITVRLWVSKVKGQHLHSISLRSQSIILRQLFFVRFSVSIKAHAININMSKAFTDKRYAREKKPYMPEKNLPWELQAVKINTAHRSSNPQYLHILSLLSDYILAQAFK